MNRNYECEHCGFVGSFKEKANRQDQYEELLRIVQNFQTDIQNAELREARLKNDFDALKEKLNSTFAETAGKTATT